MRDTSSPLTPIRNWLRSDMLMLRWVFLGLYLALLLVPAGWLLVELGEDAARFLLCIFGIMLATQALFILGGGTIRLCQPVHARRLWMPILVAATLLALLCLYMGIAMLELFFGETRWPDWAGQILLWSAGASWLIWGVLLWAYVRYRRLNRMQTLGRLASIVFAGALVEISACIPVYTVVSKYSGFFSGLPTLVCIMAGVYVMLIVFGPMIVVLFLRPCYRQEQMEATGRFCPKCEYDLTGTLMAGRDSCPECGASIPATWRAAVPPQA